MRFAALRAPWYKGYLAGGSLLMAGDTFEHAITYWAMWQAFHSPLLAGFAVIAHWLPHLLLGVPLGGLADRFDCRRLIQLSALLFAGVSVGWGVLLATHGLQPWHAVVLLLVHGLASAIWKAPDQLMLYDLVGPEELPSAVRLMATGLTLGMLVGPALGAVLLLAIGPAPSMFFNLLFYVPFFVYLLVVPLNGHRRDSTPRPRPRLRDLVETLREVPKVPPVLVVMISQGALALFIGMALLTLFPEFGDILGVGEGGVGYAVLIAATSAGAVLGGVALEAIGRVRVSARVAVMAVVVFAAACLVFALSRNYVLSVVALFVTGIGQIVADSMSTTVVQLNAPEDRRGRFIGAFQMTSQGLRAGSGVLVAVVASAIGVPNAVALDAAALLVIVVALLAVVLLRARRRPAPAAS